MYSRKAVISLISLIFCCISTYSSSAATSAEIKLHDDARLFIKVLVNYLTVDNYKQISEKYTLYNGLAKIIDNPDVRLYANDNFECADDSELTQRIIDTIKYQFINRGLLDKCSYEARISKNNCEVLIHLENKKDIERWAYLEAEYDGNALCRLHGKYNSTLKQWQFNLLEFLKDTASVWRCPNDFYYIYKSYTSDCQQEKLLKLRLNYSKWMWINMIMKRHKQAAKEKEASEDKEKRLIEFIEKSDNYKIFHSKSSRHIGHDNVRLLGEFITKYSDCFELLISFRYKDMFKHYILRINDEDIVKGDTFNNTSKDGLSEGDYIFIQGDYVFDDTNKVGKLTNWHNMSKLFPNDINHNLFPIFVP